jgi:hypothetical protein
MPAPEDADDAVVLADEVLTLLLANAAAMRALGAARSEAEVEAADEALAKRLRTA